MAAKARLSRWERTLRDNVQEGGTVLTVPFSALAYGPTGFAPFAHWLLPTLTTAYQFVYNNTLEIPKGDKRIFSRCSNLWRDYDSSSGFNPYSAATVCEHMAQDYNDSAHVNAVEGKGQAVAKVLSAEKPLEAPKSTTQKYTPYPVVWLVPRGALVYTIRRVGIKGAKDTLHWNVADNTVGFGTFRLIHPRGSTSKVLLPTIHFPPYMPSGRSALLSSTHPIFWHVGPILFVNGQPAARAKVASNTLNLMRRSYVAAQKHQHKAEPFPEKNWESFEAVLSSRNPAAAVSLDEKVGDGRTTRDLGNLMRNAEAYITSTATVGEVIAETKEALKAPVKTLREALAELPRAQEEGIIVGARIIDNNFLAIDFPALTCTRDNRVGRSKVPPLTMYCKLETANGANALNNVATLRFQETKNGQSYTVARCAGDTVGDQHVNLLMRSLGATGKLYSFVTYIRAFLRQN